MDTGSLSGDLPDKSLFALVPFLPESGFLHQRSVSPARLSRPGPLNSKRRCRQKALMSSILSEVTYDSNHAALLAPVACSWLIYLLRLPVLKLLRGSCREVRLSQTCCLFR